MHADQITSAFAVTRCVQKTKIDFKPKPQSSNEHIAGTRVTRGDEILCYQLDIRKITSGYLFAVFDTRVQT